jgi:hypothetical protein
MGAGMGIFCGMRELSDDFKLSYRSLPEVYEAFGSMVSRVASDPSIRFAGKTKKGRDKRAHRAAFINALLLWLDAQPRPRQKEVIREGMELLNALLLLDAPSPEAPGAGRPEDPGEAAAEGPRGGAYAADVPPPARGRRRRTKGA